jgi:hypothetical protein
VVRELGSVREQVEEGLADFGLVGVHGADFWRAGDDEGVAVLLHQGPHDGCHVLDELAD